MQLLLIRHAIAEDREEFALSGRPDAERPLTEKGRRRMVRNVRGLRRIGPKLERILTSPYVRAADTAQVVSAELKVPLVEPCSFLTPEHHPREFTDWFMAQDFKDAVAAVGHEPHIGRLATWLMTGQDEGKFLFRKGGMGLLEFSGAVERGSGMLLWHLTPAQLRRIGD